MRPQLSSRGLMVLLLAVVALAFTAVLSSAPAASPAASSGAPSRFTLFESGQVRPLSMSPDKRHLFAVNTPDNRLEIFRIHGQGLTQVAWAARRSPSSPSSRTPRAPSR